MRRLLLCLMSMAIPFWAVPPADAEPQGFPAHYIVFKLSAEGGLEPQFYRQVTLAAPIHGKTAEQLLSLRRESRQGKELLGFQMLDSSGRPVFQDAVWLPLWIRGEFHREPQAGSAWDIDPHLVRDPEPVFVLRLPVIKDSSLVFMERPDQRFALDRMADLVAGLPEPGLSSIATPIGPTGNPDNRVDMLVMGDGYTSAEAAKFNTDATNLINRFFSITPYAEYRNFVNVSLLFTPSAQSGADHPPYSSSCPPFDDPTCCRDPQMLQDPLAGQFVSTAFHGRYCGVQIHRLALVDSTAVYVAAASVPDWDVIFMLLNDTTYGGSGGPVPVSSNHTQAVDIARHEYGHSFTGLADEYDSAIQGSAPCSDIFGPACEPNITDQTTRALIKWLPWIPAWVPVPTPENHPSFMTVEGLFEGARYHSSGLYRHTERECTMNFLGLQFGAVCRQEYILRLYRGGWGSPSSGIELIEPGTASPASSTVEILTSRSFSIGVLSPAGGTPSVQWFVDGSPVAGATGSSFLFTPPAPGTYQVSVKVRDTTPLVNAIMGGTLVETTHEWTVTRIAVLFHDGFESGDTSAWQ
jgi:hypothetical protein